MFHGLCRLRYQALNGILPRKERENFMVWEETKS